MMVGIEAAVMDLRRQDPEQSDRFRLEASRILDHAKLPKCNLTPNLLRAARQLRQNGDIVVTSADKGGRTVVLKAEHYAEMCELHLQDQAYERVETFGTGHFKVNITNL